MKVNPIINNTTFGTVYKEKAIVNDVAANEIKAKLDENMPDYGRSCTEMVKDYGYDILLEKHGYNNAVKLSLLDGKAESSSRYVCYNKKNLGIYCPERIDTALKFDIIELPVKTYKPIVCTFIGIITGALLLAGVALFAKNCSTQKIANNETTKVVNNINANNLKSTINFLR